MYLTIFQDSFLINQDDYCLMAGARQQFIFAVVFYHRNEQGVKPAVDANRRSLGSQLSASPPGPLGPQLSKFIRRHATTESALVAILQPILHLDSNYLNIWSQS